MNAYGLSDELDDELFTALCDAVGREFAHRATEAVCQVLAAHRDAYTDLCNGPNLKERRAHLNWLLGYDLGVR